MIFYQISDINPTYSKSNWDMMGMIIRLGPLQVDLLDPSSSGLPTVLQQTAAEFWLFGDGESVSIVKVRGASASRACRQRGKTNGYVWQCYFFFRWEELGSLLLWLLSVRSLVLFCSLDDGEKICLNCVKMYLGLWDHRFWLRRQKDRRIEVRKRCKIKEVLPHGVYNKTSFPEPILVPRLSYSSLAAAPLKGISETKVECGEPNPEETEGMQTVPHLQYQIFSSNRFFSCNFLLHVKTQV